MIFTLRGLDTCHCVIHPEIMTPVSHHLTLLYLNLEEWCATRSKVTPYMWWGPPLGIRGGHF